MRTLGDPPYTLGTLGDPPFPKKIDPRFTLDGDPPFLFKIDPPYGDN